MRTVNRIRVPVWLTVALALASATTTWAQETPPPAEENAAPATETTEPAAASEAAPAELATVPVQTGETAAPVTESVTQLDEIIVTSQKRVQSIHDVPISVTALTNTMMFEQGVTDVREALQLVPNARVDSAGFFAAPRVRGFTLNNNNKSFEPPVGMVLDGIPHTRIEYFLAALMDTERMEVMRGPQGTTFGKNTTAGLIHLISYQPSSSPQGSLTIDGGELNRRHLEAAYGGPLTDGLNFRISGLLDERDGYIENTTARVLDTAPKELKDRKRTGVRFAAEAPDLWGSKLLLGFESFQLYDGGAALETIKNGPAFREALLGYDPGADFTPGNWIHSQDFADFKDVTIQRTRFQWDRDIGDWQFVALGAYSVMDQDTSLDTDFTPAPAILGTGIDHSPETYGEFRFTAPTLNGLLGLSMLPGDTDFLFGFTGGRREILNSHFTFAINNRPFYELVGAASADTGAPPDPGSAGGIVGGAPTDTDKIDQVDQGFEQIANDLSGFAHLHWRFLPTWGLELGGRYTTEKKSGFWNQVFTTPEPNSSLRAIGAVPFTATRELDMKNFQPKISLDWAPQHDLSLFLHWEKGYKAGGFNAFAFREGNDPVQDQGFEDDDLAFRDEVATNWGFDIKTWLFDRSANLNISLFREMAKDFQVLIRENPNGTIGLGTSRVVNAEEALAQGVEMDLRWAPTGWLTVMSGIGVLKTEFVKFTDGECPAGTSKKDSDGDGNPRCDQSGKPFPFAPELGATVSLRLNLPIGFEGLNLIAGTVAEYETEQYLDIDLEEQKLQKAYTRYKADIGITSVPGRWTLRVVGENLTDTVTWVRYGDVFEDVVVGSQNQPRLLYLQFRQDF